MIDPPSWFIRKWQTTRRLGPGVMRRNLWLSVYILRVGVCSYRSIGKWLIIGLCLTRENPRSSRKKNLFSILGRNDSRSGRNDFILRAKRLSVRAKRLRANRTSGETTCFPSNKSSWLLKRRVVTNRVDSTRFADFYSPPSPQHCTITKYLVTRLPISRVEI